MHSSDEITRKPEKVKENALKNTLMLLSDVVEKKYKCPSCFYSSDNVHIVRQHLITHYVKPQVCPYCQEAPTTKYHRRSLYRQDKSRFSARECSVVFTRNSEKCDVVFMANYVCELCGKKVKCILHSKQKKREIILLSGQNKKALKE